MSAAKQHVSVQQIRHLVPVSDLTEDNMQDLAGKTFIEALPKGKLLFKQGQEDNYSFYLLSGDLVLTSGPGSDKVVSGGTSQSRFPLDHNRPRLCTAIAKTDITFVRIDNDLLDILLTWDQNAGLMVDELEEDDEEGEGDWMTNMLRSQIFHRIPSGNIQAVFMRMEAMPVKEGEVVISQGDDGDYYYYIKSGRAAVTHIAKSGKEIKLAELETGTGFGEEALISGAKRNANVTMLSDGSLMRLAKKDFEELLKAPVLKTVKYPEAQQLTKEENAVWLDVRTESEHKHVAIRGSVNIPLYLLRIKAKELDTSRKYIVYCDTGRRSASATYLLTERGFDAVTLEGGLISLKKQQSGS